MRVIITGLAMMMSHLCLVEAGRSRVITTVTRTTQIQHRVEITDTSTPSGSMSFLTEEEKAEEEEAGDDTLMVKQDHNDAVKEELCTDIPAQGLLQGDTRI